MTSFKGIGPFAVDLTSERIDEQADKLATALNADPETAIYAEQVHLLKDHYPRGVAGIVETLDQLPEAKKSALIAHL